MPIEPLQLIDSRRYPVDDPRGRGRNLVEQCRRQLQETGSCLLDGFLTRDAVRLMAEEARAVAGLAYWNPDRAKRGTAYLAPADESFPPDHPRRRGDTSSVGAVAYDLIPKHHALRALYEWDPLLDFYAACLDWPRVYRYADPMGGLNVAVMREGDHLRWHFDQTDFVVSILLQDCDSGGAFEYVPNIRTKDSENYDRVQRLLDGDTSEAIRLDHRPGTLALFMGRYSIHRVTRVEGTTPRLIALLGYDNRSGVMSTDHLRMGRYGRTQPVA
jgi:hypothetical protein